MRFDTVGLNLIVISYVNQSGDITGTFRYLIVGRVIHSKNEVLGGSNVATHMCGHSFSLFDRYFQTI